MALTSLSDTFSSLSLGSLTLYKALTALVTAAVCLVLIKITLKVLRRVFASSKLDARVQKYLLAGLKLLLYLIAFVIVIQKLGVDPTSLVALLSVGSLGLTLAAEDILGNMAGGLVILSSRPFSIGDYVESSGVSGTVEEITLNHTKLLTMDGLTVLLPNKALSAAQITNYTALGRRRVEWKISAAYGAPTETVKSACLAAAGRTAKVLSDPAAEVHLSDYGESAISYVVYCWCRADDYLDVRFALGENLREAFAQAGVEMTYSHLNVHLIPSEP
jgi:small conductance mechanosensitive channel